MRLLAFLTTAFLMLGPAFAQQEQNENAASEQQPAPPDTEGKSGSGPLSYFDQVTVIGSPEEAQQIPGSAHQIAPEELRQQDHSDIHRVLRTVPGVNVQEEDGYGMRPNIGMRGTGVERSSKITLLEDGVLIAPAPYAAPAAYYVPSVGRMETIELRKGSSSIQQGPYTTGGVLNLVSTSIPSQFSGRINLAGGEDGTARLHAHLGDSGSRFGWLVETYQLQTDGFKDLDGGQGTGFELEDYLGKLRLSSSGSARFPQALELKLGYTRHDGDETYLGLTEEDFRSNPFRRYAASQQDVISAEHEQLQLRHFLQLNPRLDLTTTAYRNDFQRNWYKLDSVEGIGIASILDEPARYVGALSILRGEVDDRSGALRLRNNRRSYYSSGVQSTLTARVGARVRHRLEFGARIHQDEEDRFQDDDRYGMVDGEMVLVSRGAPGSNANRIGSADAISLFAEDQVTIGRWMVTPGVRIESIDLTQRDFGRADPDRTGANIVHRRNQLDVVIPGLGVHYRLSPTVGIFAGAHKGFAPPGPGSDEQTEPEESVNFEAGFRRVRGTSNLALVGFFNDYSNLLGKDTASSGGAGTGDLFNGGAVEVSGVEFSYANDFGTALEWGIPFRVAYTFTDAEFRSSFETSFEDWAPGVEVGDQLPYLPRHQWGASIGATRDRWGTFLSVSYGDEMRTKPGRGSIPATERTDEFLLLDLSADYRLGFGVKAFAQVRNLTDVTYIAARRPAGLRPGLPRTALVGVEWSF
jgi:Fe(3+) dicitrate transport protein